MDSEKKIGRNDPCPCGSGKKYKKCHGASQKKPVFQNPFNDPDVRKKIEQMKASEMQRVKQQGLGRPIISSFFKGYRFVAVGGRYYYSKNWKTFHDFLAEYIKFVFGKGWGVSESSDLTPNYVPHSIRELSTFFVLQSGRRSLAEPGGLQLAAKAAGVI